MQNICNLAVFEDRLIYIKKSMLLLNVLTQLCDNNNIVNASIDELVECCCSTKGKSAVRTMHGWLSTLAKNGVIKYTYNRAGHHRIIINPQYWYCGNDYNDVVARWNAFRSRVLALDERYTMIDTC